MDVLKSIADSLGVEIAKLVTNIIAFALFFGILYKFAWKGISDTIESRRNKIRRDLESIEEGKREIDRLKHEYLKKIASIEAEAQLRFGRIEADARDKAAEILAEASGKAHKFIEGARKDIESEAEQARRALMMEISALAQSAARKILAREINELDARRLVESFLVDLEKSKHAI